MTAARVHRLPNPPISRGAFVGRASELSRLAGWIDEGAPVVTVRGAPGVGKTRLAVELLRRFRDRRACAFLDLSSARTVDDVCVAVTSLFASIAGDWSPTGDPIAHAGKLLVALGESIVVLDNVEQVVEPVRDCLTVWLPLLPRSSIVITSRHALRASFERIFELESLPTAALATTPGSIADATSLFLTRVRELDAKEDRPPPDLAAIARICERLDGLPLAIELAASRLRVMSAEALEHKLDEGLLRLADRTGARAPKHHSLAEALEWSWTLLDPGERSVLAQCSVFPDSFDLAAAEAVLVAPGDPAIEDRLTSLIDKSLLAADRAASGEVRFRLLAVVREHLAPKLEPEARHASEQRHRAHYAARARAWCAAIVAGGGSATRQQIASETSNLIAVLDRLEPDASRVSAGDAEDGVWVAVAAVHHLCDRGPLALAERMLERATRIAAPFELPPELVIHVHVARGLLRLIGGRIADAIADLSIAAAGASERSSICPMALCKLGYALLPGGEAARARVHFERALRVAESIGDAPHVAISLAGLASSLLLTGALQTALRTLDRAVVLLEDARLERELGSALVARAFASMEAARLDVAMADLQRAESIFEALGSQAVVGNALRQQGDVALELGDHERAGARYERAMALLEAAGRPHVAALAEVQRGLLAAARGDTTQALTHFASVLQVPHRPPGEYRHAVLALAYRAALEARRGNAELAESDLREAERIVASTSAVDRWKMETLVALYRCQVGLLTATRIEAPVRAAESALARVAAPPSAELASLDRDVPLLRQSSHVRRAAAALRAVLDEVARPAPVERVEARLRVGPSATFFEIDAGPRIDLRRRGAVGRVLLALAKRRIDAPGEAISLDELFAAGWPGQSIDPRSIAWRVYDAIKTLRKAGLQRWLTSVDGGYRLGHELAVEILVA